jgi:gamma-glutamylputrescine oxidase
MDLLTANDRAGEYPRSWYAETAHPLPRQPAAAGDLDCDVCIVGGGYTGLSAALHLAERGFAVRLLEAQRLGFGASGRNGGQVGTGQRQDQDWLERKVGHGPARALWDMGLEAVALVRELAQRHAGGADWRDGIVWAAHKPGYVRVYHDYAGKMARAYGYDRIVPLDRAALRALVPSPGYLGGALDLGGGHVHPLKYALGLAQAAMAAGAVLHEGSRVTRIEAGTGPGALATVETEAARIRARFVILGCNGYLGRLEPQVAARVMPINNFIAATRPLSAIEAAGVLNGGHAVADSRFVVNYWRLSPDNRLLFGGGESYGWRFPADMVAKVRRPMEQVYPQLRGIEITHAWGGTLGITVNRMPHVARLAPNVMSASGWSGHGVAMATLGGKLLAEAVAGQAERFDVLARVPTPRFPGGVALRWPLLVAAMLWYALRDRL